VIEYDQRRFAEGLAVEQRVNSERASLDVRTQELESHHTDRRWQGTLFWVIVMVLCIGVVAFACGVFAAPRVGP
jgi:hypothetical protein